MNLLRSVCVYCGSSMGTKEVYRHAAESMGRELVSRGLRLVYGKFLLDDYRDQPLDPAVLTEIDDALGLARDAGLKVVPRFYYADAGDQPDAPLDRILGHIDQLGPILADNEDVIAVVQAGFIGAWGEWHSSQNGLDNPTDRAARS